MLILNNELGNDEFFTLVNVSKGWYVLTNEDIRYTIVGPHLFFKCAYTAKGRVQFLYLQSTFILTLVI